MATSSGSGDAVPRARRASAQGWRDPRLWVGVLIVAVSVLVGARILASADDTVAVWAVADDATAGDHLTSSDLVSERVHFSSHAELARYYRVDQDLPADLTLAEDVGAGDLLPRAAVGDAATPSDTADLSIEVDPGLLPTTVVRGTHVDVFLTGAKAGVTTDGKDAGNRTPALSDATVVDLPPVDAGFGQTGTRQLVLAVPAADVAGYYARLGSVSDPVVSVVAHP